MSVLDSLLEEVESHPKDEQIKVICDTIWEEERHGGDYTEEVLEEMPRGPNVFLTLKAPDRYKGMRTYLSLEREAPEKYVLITSIKDGETLKRVKAVEVKDHRPKKVLHAFAEYLQFLRGKL